MFFLYECSVGFIAAKRVGDRGTDGKGLERRAAVGAGSLPSDISKGDALR